MEIGAVANPRTFRTHDGLDLHGRTWFPKSRSPARGLLVLVHGLGEHCGRYDSHARVLAESGWVVVGYDQRGHGRSPGKSGYVPDRGDLIRDLAAVVEMSRNQFPEGELGLLGHSLGGLVVARFLAEALCGTDEVVGRIANKVDRCVLSSPALAIHLSPLQRFLLSTLGTYLPAFRVNNGLKPSWLCTDDRIVDAYVRDPWVHHRVSGNLVMFMLQSMERVAACAPNWKVPTLLLFAGEDRCVDPAGSRAFVKNAPCDLVESRCFQEMRHEIFNEPGGEAIQDVLRWLDEPLMGK